MMHVLSSVKLLSLAHPLELILVAACSAFHSLTLDSASFFFSYHGPLASNVHTGDLQVSRVALVRDRMSSVNSSSWGRACQRKIQPLANENFRINLQALLNPSSDIPNVGCGFRPLDCKKMSGI